MRKTHDGRIIGKTYRHISPESKKLLTTPIVIGALALLTGPWILNANGLHPITQITVISIILYCCIVRYNAIKYAAQDANPTSFQKYVIVRDSVDDWGRVSTLVRWVHDGSHDWLQYSRKSASGFRFITE